MTVAFQLKIPRSLQLLPGQRLRLEEVLEKERQRTAPRVQQITSDPSSPRRCQLPPSLSVSRNTHGDTLTDMPL